MKEENKNAIETIKLMIEHGHLTQEVAESYFPELVESEDEKMRKMAIEFIKQNKSFNYLLGISKEEVIAWLERLGEQLVEIDSGDIETIEVWEDIIKGKRIEWQLSDWFVDATSLLVQKLKSTNKKHLNIGEYKSMFNACVNVLRNAGHLHLAEWLEKQSEQESYGQREECKDCQMNYAGECKGSCTMKRNEQKSIVSKFKVGDIVKYNGTEYKIIAVESNGYRVYALTYDEDAASLISFNAPITLVEQKPIGESLTLEEFKNAFITKAKQYNIDLPNRSYDIHALCEELYLLKLKQEWGEKDKTGWTNTMIMIKECASNHYTKDSIKIVVDWLESLKDRCIPQPQQEWSEEDETYLDHIITAIKLYYTDDKGKENPWRSELLRWLKSLRPQKREEWNKEDERMLQGIIDDVKQHKLLNEYQLGWLSELCPQKHWKPSEEQMDCLKEAADNYPNPDVTEALYEIYRKLKAL